MKNSIAFAHPNLIKQVPVEEQITKMKDWLKHSCEVRYRELCKLLQNFDAIMALSYSSEHTIWLLIAEKSGVEVIVLVGHGSHSYFYVLTRLKRKRFFLKNNHLPTSLLMFDISSIFSKKRNEWLSSVARKNLTNTDKTQLNSVLKYYQLATVK